MEQSHPEACSSEAQASYMEGTSLLQAMRMGSARVLLSRVPLVLLLFSSCSYGAFPPPRRPILPAALRRLAGITAPMANMRSLVSLPSIGRTAQVKTREPAKVTGRYRFSFLGSFSFSKYRRVMVLAHSTGAGKRFLRLEVRQCGLPAP